MRDLVDAAELAALLDDASVVVADVRWYLDGRSGRAAYDAGHIPGAVFVDLETVLAAPPGEGPGRHPLPDPEVFAAGMRDAGISDDDVVVACDDAGGSVAARLWWMLRVTGHAAAVLDGGIQAWTGPLEAGTQSSRPGGSFTAAPWPRSQIVDADEVARMLREGASVVDARAAERYRGDVEPIDPRAGHIPGARSAPWMDNLSPDGTFLTPDQLRARYESLGAVPDGPVVAYCGSGVTACHDVLALRLAGFDDVRLYEGSWSDWCSDPARPAATGD